MVSFDCARDFVVQGDTALYNLREERKRITGCTATGEAISNPGVADLPVNRDMSGPDNDHSTVNSLTEVMNALELAGNSTAEDRAEAALTSLGFPKDMITSCSSELSGGWRIRALLARALFAPPELLMLDEPTNHLDLHGMLWLQDFLVGIDSCVIVVSHDRAFLDAVSTDIIVLENRSLQYFHGNLTAYLEHKEVVFRKQQKRYENQEMKRQHIQKSIQKGVQRARRSGDDKVLGMVASRKKKLDRLGAEKREDGKKWKVYSQRKSGTLREYENSIDGTRHAVRKYEEEEEEEERNKNRSRKRPK